MAVSSELLCSFELLKPLDSSALKHHIKKGRNKRQTMLNSPVRPCFVHYISDLPLIFHYSLLPSILKAIDLANTADRIMQDNREEPDPCHYREVHNPNLGQHARIGVSDLSPRPRRRGAVLFVPESKVHMSNSDIVMY
jgi:hypothetical protein